LTLILNPDSYFRTYLYGVLLVNWLPAGCRVSKSLRCLCVRRVGLVLHYCIHCQCFIQTLRCWGEITWP